MNLTATRLENIKFHKVTGGSGDRGLKQISQKIKTSWWSILKYFIWQCYFKYMHGGCRNQFLQPQTATPSQFTSFSIVPTSLKCRLRWLFTFSLVWIHRLPWYQLTCDPIQFVVASSAMRCNLNPSFLLWAVFKPVTIDDWFVLTDNNI